MIKRISLIFLSFLFVFPLFSSTMEKDYLSLSLIKMTRSNSYKELNEEYNALILNNEATDILKDLSSFTLSPEQKIYEKNMNNSFTLMKYKKALSTTPRVCYKEDMKTLVSKTLLTSRFYNNYSYRLFRFYDPVFESVLSDKQIAFSLYNKKFDKDKNTIERNLLEKFIRIEKSNDPLLAISLLEDEDFRKYFTSFPPFYATLAFFYIESGDVKKGKDMIDKYFSLNPLPCDKYYVDVLKTKITLLIKEGSKENEVRSLLKKLEDITSSFTDYSFIAKVYFLLDDISSSNSYITKALEKDSNNYDAIILSKIIEGLDKDSKINKLYPYYDISFNSFPEDGVGGNKLTEPFTIPNSIKDRLYFIIPNTTLINENYTMKVFLNDKEVTNFHRMGTPKGTIFFFDKSEKLQNIKDKWTVDIKFISNVYSTYTTLSYEIKPLSKKDVSLLYKEMDVSGMRNALFTPSFPFTFITEDNPLTPKIIKMDKSKDSFLDKLLNKVEKKERALLDYSFTVEDLEKETDTIIKEFTKQNKKDNIPEPLCFVEERAQKEIRDDFLMDTASLDKIFTIFNEGSIKGSRVYKASLIERGGDYYLITLKSIK